MYIYIYIYTYRGYLGRTLEAPIPKMSGLVGKNDLLSKAFIFPTCFRALWNCRSIETSTGARRRARYTKRVRKRDTSIVMCVYVYIYIYVYV